MLPAVVDGRGVLNRLPLFRDGTPPEESGSQGAECRSRSRRRRETEKATFPAKATRSHLKTWGKSREWAAQNAQDGVVLEGLQTLAHFSGALSHSAGDENGWRAARSTAACTGGGAGARGAAALSAGIPKTCRVRLHNVRVTDAKEVGVGNPAEETFCHPDAQFNAKRSATVKRAIVNLRTGFGLVLSANRRVFNEALIPRHNNFWGCPVFAPSGLRFRLLPRPAERAPLRWLARRTLQVRSACG